jgi:hypothetical protein
VDLLRFRAKQGNSKAKKVPSQQLPWRHGQKYQPRNNPQRQLLCRLEFKIELELELTPGAYNEKKSKFLQTNSFKWNRLNVFRRLSSFDRGLQNSKVLRIPFYIILTSILIKTKRNLKEPARHFSVYALGVIQTRMTQKPLLW